jgi:hypothetical protein
MDSNIDTPTSENQAVTWGSTLAACLSSFPAILHILNTEGLSSDPLALLAFMRNPTASQALHALFSSLNSAYTAAHDEITINQNQLRIANEQLRDATEQARSKSALLDHLTERLTETPTPRTLDHRISRNPEPFSGDDKNIVYRQETYGTWKSQVRLNFEQDSNVINTEKCRILHICGLLSGQAYQNNHDLLDTVTHIGISGESEKLGSKRFAHFAGFAS